VTTVILNRFVDARVEPWRNGRGSTRVLYSDAHGLAAWSLRVSVADIAGPSTFSTFAGVDRYLLTLGPGRLSLRIDGADSELQPFACRFFRGESEVSAQPTEASTHVLNIMAQRSTRKAWVLVKDPNRGDTVKPLNSRGVTVLVALKPCTVDGESLEPLDSVVLPAGGRSVQCMGLHALINGSWTDQGGTP
jgi:hypothetical protein